jgi:endonuclease/exonuclease/phosphatase family metal-dependent hydrolase
MRALLGTTLLLALVASGCDGGEPGPSTELRVISWDLYRGFGLGALTGAADEAELRTRTFDAYRNVLLTNFPNRARRVVDQIEAARPDVVALQEVALYRTQSPSNYAGDPSAPDASQVRLDFLTVLLDSLAGRGLDYRVAASVTTADFELPGASGSTTLDIRVTDRDVILVAAGVPATIIAEQTYSAGTTVQAAGLSLPFSRGFVAVRIDRNDVPVTVVSTQLHSDANGGVAQRAELLAALPQAGPLLVAGGLGTAVDPPGLDDAWTQFQPSDTGFTCCLSPTIDDTVVPFATRPDRILVRGGVVLEMVRLGTELRDRLVSGLWPSDHAGLGARILFQSAR